MNPVPQQSPVRLLKESFHEEAGHRNRWMEKLASSAEAIGSLAQLEDDEQGEIRLLLFSGP